MPDLPFERFVCSKTPNQHDINFSIVPVHLRVTYAACVSFVWSCVLSALRGDMKPA